MCPDFNPRSREGSDGMVFPATSDMIYFNPRSREGSDVRKIYGRGHGKISIHAPAKGATKESAENVKTNIAFQSTLPRRERLAGHTRYKAAVKLFQSTLPRRERHEVGEGTFSFVVDFNPRSREGSDHL